MTAPRTLSEVVEWLEQMAAVAWERTEDPDNLALFHRGQRAAYETAVELIRSLPASTPAALRSALEAAPREEAEREDLAALIRQLVSVKTEAGRASMAERAVDYLRRKGLQGSILRESPAPREEWRERAREAAEWLRRCTFDADPREAEWPARRLRDQLALIRNTARRALAALESALESPAASPGEGGLRGGGRDGLLPCPFCGEGVNLRVCRTRDDNDNFYVVCLECLGRGGDRYGHGEGSAHAITTWNRRAESAAALSAEPVADGGLRERMEEVARQLDELAHGEKLAAGRAPDGAHYSEEPALHGGKSAAYHDAKSMVLAALAEPVANTSPRAMDVATCGICHGVSITVDAPAEDEPFDDDLRAAVEAALDDAEKSSAPAWPTPPEVMVALREIALGRYNATTCARRATDALAALAKPAPPGEVSGGRGIYVASRASVPERAAMWRRLRDEGAPIVSTWIDEAGEGETADLSELWERVAREVRSAAALVLYAERDDFPLKGAYIEVGMALALGRPVYVVLPGVELESRSCRPTGSWVRHPTVTICATVEEAMARASATPTPERADPPGLREAASRVLTRCEALDRILAGARRGGVTALDSDHDVAAATEGAEATLRAILAGPRPEPADATVEGA